MSSTQGAASLGARTQATKDGEEPATLIGDGQFGHPAQASDEAFCYLKDPGDYDAMLEIGEACKRRPLQNAQGG